MSELLEIKDLEVIYTSGSRIVRALNGINLSLGKKETLGLVGETGAGKTTAALSIMRLLPERTGKAINGSITFDKLSLLKLNETQMQALRGARISMIFQDPMTSLNPVMPVGQQIKEALFLHSGANISREQVNERVDEMLKLVGIDPSRKAEYPHQFSGGMKQRVVIAMALACSPELLIADEPTTALDVTIQAQVLDIMEDLKQKLNMSMLLITHDLGIVARTCDKVAVLYSGEVVEFGTFEDFFVNEKHHPYTEGLFGSIPDIFSDEKRLRPIEGSLPDPTNLPEGCKFHPRCPRRMERCLKINPEVYRSGTHSVKCHLYSSEAGYGQ